MRNHEQGTQQVYNIMYEYGDEMKEFREAVGPVPAGVFGQCP